MLRFLCPQWVFDNYEAVTPEFLKEHGVKLLLADLDFTLAPKSQSEPDESLTRWFLWNETACLALSSMGEDPDAQQVEIVVFLQNYQDYT